MGTDLANHTKWARSVKRRDGRCLNCGSVSDLTAHHVLSWKEHPASRFDLSNGKTLCRSCHKQQRKPHRLGLVAPTHTEWDNDCLVWTEMISGRWTRSTTVLRQGSKYFVVCRCQCGTIKKVDKVALGKGRSKSCGCLQRELLSKRMSGTSNTMFTHGQSCRKSWTKEYRTWVDMKTRCLDSNCRSFDLYGGRGIRFCERWHRFEAFFEDVGRAPANDHELDRIDPSGDYSPSNCRWITRKEQMRNTRCNHLLTIDGSTKTIIEWSELSGVNAKTLYSRKYRGWSDERCVKEKVKNGKNL
jgi:hypothetical protein